MTVESDIKVLMGAVGGLRAQLQSLAAESGHAVKTLEKTVVKLEGRIAKLEQQIRKR